MNDTVTETRLFDGRFASTQAVGVVGRSPLNHNQEVVGSIPIDTSRRRMSLAVKTPLSPATSPDKGLAAGLD